MRKKYLEENKKEIENDRKLAEKLKRWISAQLNLRTLAYIQQNLYKDKQKTLNLNRKLPTQAENLNQEKRLY